ncbi:hypothetical protein [Cupriavidus sp. RAF12]|uniref:hypothetical protein n=1 Tax=Cupriavidus sp. RAF12 TaxID=3233050 RepID=UPI003F922683
MAKNVPITEWIIEQITANNGGDSIDTSKIQVYEAIAVSTRPLSKRGTLFHQGRISEGTLHQMAAYLNNAGFVPLHTLHAQGQELPVGRLFYAEVHQAFDGSFDLRALFYVDKSETKLIAKLDSGSIDEVSVGLLNTHLFCSQCGWDFRGADATFDHLWSQTCENGHTVGVDGMYLKLEGMDSWNETSLVSKGASNNAKIVGRTRQVLSAEAYEKLAASGTSPEAILLFATTKQGNPEVDLTKAIDEITNLKAAAIVHGTEKTELTAKLAAANTEIEQLKAKPAELQTQLDAANAKVGEVETAHAATKAELEAKTNTVTELQTKLDVALAANPGGNSKPAVTDASKAATTNLSAFRQRA